MKDYALELASTQTGYNAKVNIMREYMQAYALRVLHDKGLFRRAAFVGGTALRFLYDLPRFSEDLDFSVTGGEGVGFVDLMKAVKDEFILAGYDVSVSYNDEKTVNHAFVRFAGLLYEAGLSPQKDQKFSIKIELDTNPPQGAKLESRLVNKYFPVAFMSYDPASLLAGKLHAILCRKHTKGRDYFDIGWYLSRWKDINPNIELLKNALIQTGWKGDMPSDGNWKDLLCKAVESADWKKVRNDVESFLERQADLEMFSKGNILKIISDA
jgi:predicted nucleotidyltransferase component of viral defense system